MKELVDRLVHWLRDRVKDAGADGLVLGMSGGVDSSVLAVLCKTAFPGNTLGLLLPCHSIQQDIDHAYLLAHRFGIETDLIRLDAVYDSMIAILPDYKNRDQGCPTAEANLKPRLRMTTIYYFANRLNYLAAGAGNKCELGIGYFSKYGDGGVDIMPLGNLVKSQVREMARHLQVPDEIIEKPPSAGLWEGQTDEQEMGLTYEHLDRYFTSQTVPEEVRRSIESRIARNSHKRALPPVPGF
jgi:NAD+ synthase